MDLFDVRVERAAHDEPHDHLGALVAAAAHEVLDRHAGQALRIARGEPRFGINEAAIRAMKATRFSSPMKDGKRVKTWFPQQFDFAP